jgi:hypothetical protein
MCLWWKVSPARTHTQETLRSFCSISLIHLERKMISFWGRRPRTEETRSLNRPQERLETYFTLTGCSLSAQMMPRDRQGTRNRKIPQHMHRLFVYQLEHRISVPSCNGDCKGDSSHYMLSNIWKQKQLTVNKGTCWMSLWSIPYNVLGKTILVKRALGTKVLHLETAV